MGLTDAMPGVQGRSHRRNRAGRERGSPQAKDPHRQRTLRQSGRWARALAGITVRLYRVEGRTSPPLEIARTITDVDGRYAFAGLEPPQARRPTSIS